MAYGLLAEGFVMPTLNELIQEQYAEQRAIFGDSVDLGADSPNGQMANIFAEREYKLWQGLQATYNAFDPDKSNGASLEAVSAITGTTRSFAAPSTVIGTFTGTPSSSLLAGRVASVAGTGRRFATTEDAVIATVTAWTAASYGVGDRRTRGGNVYEASTAGTSVTGPSGTGTGITDGGTAVWKFLGAGTGAVDIPMESEDDGPIVATARTLTVIETPTGGWSGVVNNLDADLGTAEETDASLRLKREDELRATGNAALDAIRAKLLLVEGVTQVTVFENPTDTTDGDGIPPHSIEALVQGGEDQDVLNAVLAAKAGGIRAYGTSITGTAEDSEGTEHTLQATRPTNKNIWAIVNLVIDSGLYPLDGNDQIEAALTAYGDLQPTGKNVVASALESRCFTVPGVLEAECLIGLTDPPSTRTTVPIALREEMKLDTSRITVNTTPGTP